MSAITNLVHTRTSKRQPCLTIIYIFTIFGEGPLGPAPWNGGVWSLETRLSPRSPMPSLVDVVQTVRTYVWVCADPPVKLDPP